MNIFQKITPQYKSCIKSCPSDRDGHIVMIQTKIKVINKLGLHARAATKLASLAGRYSCAIRTGEKPPLVDAKSIMSLMLLAANQGTDLIFEFDGYEESMFDPTSVSQMDVRIKS